MPITTDALSIGMLLEGVRQLGLAVKELKEIQDEKNHACAVDFVLENEKGDQIGVVKTADGTVNFVVKDVKKESVQTTMNQVKQVYSRLKILNEVKAKGYKQVKEEKLPNGSIRLVVQKWR